VPATLQATSAARIDRLDPKAKRTLSAAAVIGSRFSRGLPETPGIAPALEALAGGELIDQIRISRQPEYVFHHPLIRAVAYESQLRSDRSQLHRRVAAAIEAREPESADQNAALIAEHLEAAGDGHAAYGWHMRAATWATNRNIAAARSSWERAQRIADALPAEDPTGQPCASPREPCCAGPPFESMRIWRAPASMNCGSCAPPPGTRRHSVDLRQGCVWRVARRAAVVTNGHRPSRR
jgi:predicted ATPase